ncbi:hypothetical protein P3T18_001217 [Paraburkholderia sp. GAS199]|uniref:hypothetical protein n=1 Tax=Paraburkholderia sp. GAS199 TaxID=3035126 RepID=UPI003D259AB6
MKTRIFTYLACGCGHHGTIVESFELSASNDGWYQAWLRNLSHAGHYDALDELFAETTPGCPICGQSLGPEHIVGRSVQPGLAELRPDQREANAISPVFSARGASLTSGPSRARLRLVSSREFP